jgi:4-amino-4-deoxy-L-arabinose transferase-like glycosyltransferase
MSEITKSKIQNPKSIDRITWLLFAMVIVTVYFFALDIPLIGPDEPRYSQVAREMFQRNDWITPTIGNFDWFEKPALLYWLQIASFKLFGVSEFAARFGSAIFGLGTVLSLWIFGRFLAKENTENHREFKNDEPISKNSVNSVAKKDFANWLALIAASSIGLLSFSRAASFDIILTFPITAALIAFFIFDQTERKSSFTFYFSLFAFHFLTGVALLAKGLVGIVFPLAIVAFYYVLSWRFPSKTFIFSMFWGTIVSVLVASAWYLPMYQVNGWKFIDEFFIQHHFQRYTSNKYLHPQPFWFFWVILPLMTIPWLPFFLVSIWNFFKEIFNRRDVETQRGKILPISASPLFIFSVSWILVPLVFFSLSGSKLPGYILPVLPAAMILTAVSVYKFIQNSTKRKFLIQFTAFLTFLCVAILAKFVVTDFLREETVWHLVEMANAKGYKNEKVVNLHTISHSLEFYGAGRLVRETDGKQRKLYGVSEVVEQMQKDNSTQILAVIPLEYLYTLNKAENIESEVLDDNGELAMVIIKRK